MSRWLHSGLRRDICVVIAGMGEASDREVKARLEEVYGDRVAPSQFQGAIDALVRQGHVNRWVDGLTDRVELTEAGAAALEQHVEWVQSSLETA